MVIEVPIKTGRGQNDRAHWRTRHRQNKLHQQSTWVSLAQAFPGGVNKPKAPLTVLLTRKSYGVLDDDNLSGSLKAVRDAVAAWLGVDDGDLRVRYRYAQHKTAKRGEYGVMIEFIEG